MFQWHRYFERARGENSSDTNKRATMTNDIDIANQQVVPNYNINESADSIVFKCKTVRGNGTRDQDKGDLKVKGDDPQEVAQQVAETLDALEEQGVHEKLRQMQPGENDE